MEGTGYIQYGLMNKPKKKQKSFEQRKLESELYMDRRYQHRFVRAKDTRARRKKHMNNIIEEELDDAIHTTDTTRR